MTTDTNPSQKMKNLPFKPTALGRAALLAKKKPDPNDDGLDLFRRSKEMAPTLLAEQEERLQRKHKLKKEAKKAKASRGKRRINDDEEHAVGSQASGKDTSSSCKQNKDAKGAEHREDDIVHPGEDEEELKSLVTPPSSKRMRHDKTWPPNSSPGAAPLSQSSAPTSPSPIRKSRRQANLPPPKSPGVGPAPKVTPAPICIDSDDEDVKVARPSQPVTSTKIPDVESDEDNDVQEVDEFAKYVQRAEEQRALALSQTKDDMEFGDESRQSDVFIYISSNIKDAKPALVKINFNLTLKDLRRSWFRAQQRANVVLPPGFTEEDAVLTWCDTPVYNSITLGNLGITLSASGKLSAVGPQRRGIREDGERVLMNIWTSEGFRDHEEKLRRKREADNFADGEGDANLEIKPEPILKITLAARDLGPAELKVQPSTTADTVITTYRALKNIPSSQEVTLWFDGEMLEEHVTMSEAEIDDMDTIEVHIKK